jgi:hypothetical protein
MDRHISAPQCYDIVELYVHVRHVQLHNFSNARSPAHSGITNSRSIKVYSQDLFTFCTRDRRIFCCFCWMA